MTTARTITKRCRGCKQEVLLTDFHLRSGYRGKIDIPTEPKHVISECKSCMRERGKNSKRLSPHETRTASETTFIEYLASRGIPALPGKAIRAADVDVIALGHVWIEVKYSTLAYIQGAERFRFSFTPNQTKYGPRGHIVALICNWGNDKLTFHLLPYNHQVFFNEHGKMKTGLQFVPGQIEAVKHVHRHILTQQVMNYYENRTELINRYITRIHNALRAGLRAEYGKPFARDYIAIAPAIKAKKETA